VPECSAPARQGEATIASRKAQASGSAKSIAQVTGETIERDRLRAEIDRLRQEVSRLQSRVEEANDQRVADAERHQSEIDRLEATVKRLRTELAEAQKPWLSKFLKR
jgi:predicted RNase H-like nuclease (RuvC/YqgF family)